MESDFVNKELMAVEFPAIVDNDSKALAMLGGMTQISKILKNSGQRLHLSFRPGNVFAKSCCADAHPTSALAIRVQQLRHKQTGERKFSFNVIGVVKNVYKFESLHDFEYGPYSKMASNLSDSDLTEMYKVFYKDIVPEKPLTSFSDYFKKDAPLYLPPMLFSRYDRPTNYFFAPKFKTQIHISKEEKHRVITLDRKSRKSYTTFITMLDKTPQEPHPLCAKKVESLSHETSKVIECVTELFKTRPIWTKNALVYHLSPQLSDNLLKAILPFVAYYMKNGPWARTWIRFGYDPREEPEAKKYQIVDLRIMQKYPGEELPVAQKRKIFCLHNQLTRRNLSKQNWDSTILNDEEDSNSKSMTETTFRFKPGVVPEARQVCYQLCDIELPEVQSMCSVNPEESTFDSNEGWCQPDYQNQVRYYLLCQINPLLDRLPPKPPSSLFSSATVEASSKTNKRTDFQRETFDSTVVKEENLTDDIEEMDLDDTYQDNESSDEEEEEYTAPREISLRPRDAISKLQEVSVDIDGAEDYEESVLDDSDEDPDFKPDDSL